MSPENFLSDVQDTPQGRVGFLHLAIVLSSETIDRERDLAKNRGKYVFSVHRQHVVDVSGFVIIYGFLGQQPKETQEEFDMPMYEYKCSDCRKEFEELVSNQEELPLCPYCKSKNVAKLMSACAVQTEGSGGDMPDLGNMPSMGGGGCGPGG